LKLNIKKNTILKFDIKSVERGEQRL